MTVANDINNTPATFNDVDVIARTAADDLLIRLDWFTLQPKTVVVLGWGREALQQELQAKYPEANVLAELPSDQPIDMLFANLILPWQADYQATLIDWQQKMRPEGVLLISALGPDTLKECHNKLNRVPRCVDMHEVGDALASMGFSDPVMEVQQYTLEYSKTEKRWQELTAHDLWIGASAEQLDLPELTLTFELVYGHAFCVDAVKQQKNSHGETMVSLAEMRQALRG